MIETWVLIGLIVCFSIGIFNTLQKQLVKDNTPIDVGYHTNLMASIFLLPLTVYYLINYTVSIEILGFLALTGLFNAVGFYLFPLALSTEDLGVIAPTKGITPITIAIIEPIIFLNLDYSIEFVGAALLAGAGLYIAFSENGILTPIEKLNSRGVLFGLGSAIVIAGAILTDRFAVHAMEFSPHVYVFGLTFTTATFLSIFRVYKQGTLPSPPKRKYIPVGIARAVAVGGGVFTLSLTTGTQYNILVQLAIPLSIILGYIYLEERRFTAQQLLGSLLIIMGVYLIL